MQKSTQILEPPVSVNSNCELVEEFLWILVQRPFLKKDGLSREQKRQLADYPCTKPLEAKMRRGKD